MPDSLNVVAGTEVVETISANQDILMSMEDSVSESHSVDSMIDTLSMEQHHSALLLVEEVRGRDASLRNDSEGIMSWVMLFVIGIFVAVSFRYKNNFKYIKGIIGDLTEIRSRNNMFDDTVRESSFLIALNVMCVVSVALLFHRVASLYIDGFAKIDLSESMLVVGVVTVCYYLFQYVAYWLCGNIFGDRQKTSIWIKGFTSSQGLLGVILFPISLISLFYPQAAVAMCVVGGLVYVLGRIVFIFKGFRIFFVEISSWLLFLYYLCSVEIIPMIFAYFLVSQACKTLI